VGKFLTPMGIETGQTTVKAKEAMLIFRYTISTQARWSQYEPK
jgi:hypothetical protein